jgi:diguanylate cyclase (GGDEF)-like protein
MAAPVVFALALVGALLVGAGFVFGSRRVRLREQELQTALDQQGEQLTLLGHELLRHSARDPATGLHTQQYFQDFLEREWRRASREHRSVTVFMVEIDHFREFHDRQGKAQADACLQTIAGVLEPILHRPGDLIARYGGAGKFGVVLGNTDQKGAMILAERLRLAVENLKMPNPASPAARFTTATIGVAVMTPDVQGAWQDIELIAAAERALGQAREAGRNSVGLGTQDADAGA